MQTLNPTTGKLIRNFSEHSSGEVRSAIERTHAAFVRWRNVPLEDRASLLRRVASRLRGESRVLAALIVQEMGKPIGQALAEVEKCAVGCDYYADQGAGLLASESVATDATRSYVRFDPIGVVLAIMPWNFPFWQVFRFAAPALMAGNTALLKHATNVTGCALAIERVIRDAGFPADVFNTLLVSSDRVADVIADPLVRAVTLTGSDAAGRAVASVAGRHLKKCVLELGGADPFIVLADADIEHAAEQAVVARTQNNGQSCIAAKRFLVDDSVADEFTAAFVRRMKALHVGDPADERTEIGPLARHDLREDLHDQVLRSVAAGATVCCGGNHVPGPGFFYQPTVLSDVQPGTPAFDEEMFGPVAAVTRVQNPEEAIALANRSAFGLGASLWTRDLSNAERMAAEIDSGSVFINGIVKSDPRLPFGGVKDSGYGRELSHFGLREFVNIKTVWVQ
ncbi:MAG: NAD-dependent succinate-semialdehyde dehydrogenase [Planctomycetaceae bacterium]